ncbi:MAG: hypothetical protein P1U89_00105 [Verrucomicrobiales bacterium]|nr:hypothetical protein [Verrucomicrobiales bacterium]
MASPSTSGREELAAILSVAAQQDGPVRLFVPKGPKLRKLNPGLFPAGAKGKDRELLNEMVGSMLEEVMSLPKMVMLTDFGIETLLRNTPQNQRKALVAKCSPLYREPLLSAWAKFAIRGEEVFLEKAIKDHYGKWFPETKDVSKLDEFREYLAQEIANSWNSASGEEAQKRLAHLLRIIGAEPLGKKDETVVFTGLQHTPLEPLFPGDPAVIARQGWIFPKSTNPILLAKAEVIPASN